MPHQGRRLILITGIPGAGKTSYGESFARKYGFDHFDLEKTALLKQLLSKPSEFIGEILQRKTDIVVTWGFVPNDDQMAVVDQFKRSGFTLVWFDGNRPAALRNFIARKTVPEECFYRQMWAIERSGVVRKIKPIVVNTFEEPWRFRTAEAIFEEIGKLGDRS